jgi:hypothetical protein
MSTQQQDLVALVARATTALHVWVAEIDDPDANYDTNVVGVFVTTEAAKAACQAAAPGPLDDWAADEAAGWLRSSTKGASDNSDVVCDIHRETLTGGSQ